MLRKGKNNQYIRILKLAMNGAGIAAEIPLVRYIAPLVPYKTFRDMFNTREYLMQYSRRAVTNSRKNSESAHNIFSGLVHESARDQSLSDEEVAIEAGNLIMAGSDTTAVTLTYLIWAVMCRPTLHAQLENELASLSNNYQETDLELLPSLNATITETLRLYGAAPGSLPRSVPEGGVKLSGYYIPAGITVSTQSYSIHRNETLFPEPENFNPSRWIPGNERVSDEAKAALSPFGAGSRICLGIHLSWMELRLATAEFFRRCGNVRLAPGSTEESMWPEHYFLIVPSGHKCEVVVDS